MRSPDEPGADPLYTLGMRAEGPVAVVTGAGSGIGRRVSLELVAVGYRVVLAGRRVSTLDETAAAAPESTLVVPTDVTDPAAVRDLFARARDRYGRVDVLFNNAGAFGKTAPIADVTYEQWRSVVDTNLTGAFLCAQD